MPFRCKSQKSPITMKIATWNIDRLRNKKNLAPIQEYLQKLDADILILTEFNKIVELPFYKFNVEAQSLPKELYNYNATERRVSIFSKFPIIQILKTYDAKTSCCAEFETTYGNLIVYGTIVGVVGISDKNFSIDLDSQIEDINTFSKFENFCYSGDLNMSFSDNYYFTKNGREKFTKCFKKNNLQITTESLKENIDHIVITERLTKQFKIKLYEWNVDKKLSDHKGILHRIREIETAYNRR